MTPDAIKALRARTGLSLRRLSLIIHRHHNTLWKYEAGRMAIPPAYVIRLATLAYQLRPPAHPGQHCGGTGVTR